MHVEIWSSAGRRSLRVREDNEVYDEMTLRGPANVLDQLKPLISVAGDAATHDQIATLRNVPHDPFDAHDLDRLTGVLLAGCSLLKHLAELSGAFNHPYRQPHTLTTMLTGVPSLAHIIT